MVPTCSLQELCSFDFCCNSLLAAFLDLAGSGGIAQIAMRLLQAGKYVVVDSERINTALVGTLSKGREQGDTLLLCFSCDDPLFFWGHNFEGARGVDPLDQANVVCQRVCRILLQHLIESFISMFEVFGVGTK